MRVSGKVALVTGAFGGIGKVSAEALAREGAAVVAADIKPSSPSYAGEGVEYIRLDVRNDAEWKVLVANIVARHGRIDIMVNAAGITAYQDLHEVDDSVWHDVVAVNQTALMYAYRAVIPVMIAQKGGSIVTISSIFGLNAVSGIAAYHASKGAVTLMARNAALTYAKHGVRVNSIHPGLIDTPMARERDTGGQAETIALTPLGRIGLAEEVATGVLFLASDEASYITGIQMPIDGGYLAQ
jgi:NAD(P)-dependent dehydrogenase (short-subunit alcohol dehydrogenase family)